MHYIISPECSVVMRFPWRDLHRNIQLWGFIPRRLHDGRVHRCYCWQ